MASEILTWIADSPWLMLFLFSAAVLIGYGAIVWAGIRIMAKDLENY